MSKIYEMSDGRKAALYSEGSRILFYTFPVRRGNLPVVVKEDYLQDLTTMEFRGTLFFVYKNLEKQIILGSMGVAEDRIMLTESGTTGEISHVRLGQAGGNLCLTYIREQVLEGGSRQAKGEEKTVHRNYILEVIFPYRNRETMRIGEGLAGTDYEMHLIGGQPILTFQEDTGRRQIYTWKEGRFQRITPREETKEKYEQEMERMEETYRQETSRREAAYREEMRGREETYRQEINRMEERYRQEINRMEEDYRQEINRMEEDYRQEMRGLEEGYGEQLKKAAAQYEELATVARNLQEALRQYT